MPQTIIPDSFFRLRAQGEYRPAPSMLAAAFLARRFKAPQVPARDVLDAFKRNPPKPSLCGRNSWWRPGQGHILATRETAREWSTEGDGEGYAFREVRKAEASPYSRDECDYYRATEWQGEDEGNHPMVARIRGGWVAGYYVPASDWSTWDLSEVYESDADGDPPRDAIRAAHDMARDAAEKESEYQEGYANGRMAREALREALGEAAHGVHDARKMREGARAALRRALAQREGVAAGFVPPDVLAEACRLYRECVLRMREHLETAAETRRDAWKAYRDATPYRGRGATYERDPGPAGFWEGFDNA